MKLQGSKTGVFIGCMATEAHQAWSSNADNLTGYEMTGGARTMFANRLSYFFDLKGVYQKCITAFHHLDSRSPGELNQCLDQ